MIKLFQILFISTLFFACSENKQQKLIDPKNEITEAKNVDITNDKKMHKDIDIDYCMGSFNPSTHESFIKIDTKYADREGMYMREDAYDAFIAMFNAAYKDGIKLQIKSATRNFNYQKRIWERKWTGETILSDGTNVKTDIENPVNKALKILEYSSMPGTSRHHWGTDIDLNAFNNEYFENGQGLKIYNWLTENAAKYNFSQPYTPIGSDRPHGYNEEKWHWSFTAISVDVTKFAEENLKNHMIKGFTGDETPEAIDVVGKYVLGVHSSCR